MVSGILQTPLISNYRKSIDLTVMSCDNHNMDSEESSTEDYATPQRLAMYLEAGWSDYLLAPTDSESDSLDDTSRNPLTEYVKPTFFQNIASRTREWTEAISLDVNSICDIGGGAGRTIFEMNIKFPESNRIVLLEPSLKFCNWAENLLASTEPLPKLPILGTLKGPEWVSAHRKPPSIPRALERLSILNQRIEDATNLKGFDLITCLNVVDRHPQPPELITRIKNMMNPGGILVLSSPFDFHENSTPDKEHWIEDLDILFDVEWEPVGRDELFYEFRSFNRKWTRYSSQVICKQLKAV